MIKLIEELRKVGFTEYEAKVYITLFEYGETTGYEISKASGVPKPNTYAALNSIVDKGFAYKLNGSTTLYKARDFSEISFNILNDIKLSLNYIESNLPKPSRQNESFSNIKGHEKILDKAIHMIMKAKKRIFIDVWEEEFSVLCDYLCEAASHGIKVVAIIIGDIDAKKYSSIKHIYIHRRDDRWIKDCQRNMCIVCDDEVLNGQTGSSESVAMFSNIKNFVDFSIDAFLHDIILEEAVKLSNKEVCKILKEIESNILSDM